MQQLCALISIVLVLKKVPRTGENIGRSAGGLSTKIHALCDALGNPTAFHLTEGQHHDLEGADALMDRMTEADAVLADKAYDADERMRKKLEEKGCTPVIPTKSNQI